MNLVREFTFPDSLFASIEHAYGFDPQTRLHIRLSSLVDIVQHIAVPQRVWSSRTNTYIWQYSIERRNVISWEEAVLYIQDAADDFFYSCKRY